MSEDARPESGMDSKAPELVIIGGGVATGKTRFRQERFSQGYVTLDAGEIFILLSNGEYYDFPAHLEAEMDSIGLEIASRAIRQRLNIVTEMIGDSVPDMTEVVNAMRSVGYRVDYQALTCDLDVAMQRNMSRGPDNISAHYTQKYHQKWLIDAAAQYREDQ